MLQGGPLDKEAITQMLMSSLGAAQPAPQPLEDANRVLYPTEYEPKDLPDAPYRRLLELSQTSETLQLHLKEPTSVLSRLARVSHDFIKGSMLLFNLPSREFQAKYQQSLTLALRFLFTAFSGNSFYGPLGSKYNACVPDDCPNFGPEKSQVFLSTVLVEMPVCFLPPGMSFDASEMAQDAWSEKLLSRWTEALKNGTWNTAPKGTLMTGALECELIIMTLYIGSRLLKSVDPRHGGRDAMCLLLRKSHDLLCGAAHLLGIQRQVMSGPLASGRFKPAAVKAKFTIPSLLALVLNRDFLVRLMIDMAEAYSLDESSLQEALQTAHMCQSFGSKVWDAEARLLRGQLLMRDSQFKEAEAEFQSALVRVGPYYPNLAAACHREIGFCVALGSRGRTFTVSEIRDLWIRAEELTQGGEQSAIWASCRRTSETHSYLRTLLEKLDNESPSTVVACIGSSPQAREMLSIRKISVNGRKCAGCDLSFEQGMSQCSRCKDPKYVVCGVACQRKDWPRHKAGCVPP